MISVEHGAFVAEELGFDMVDAVIKALDNAGYSNQTAQKVMIQSTNSSVLVKFKQQTKYDLVYMISEDVRDAAPSSLADIKKFVGAVSVDASSVFPENHHFTTYQTTSNLSFGSSLLLLATSPPASLMLLLRLILLPQSHTGPPPSCIETISS